MKYFIAVTLFQILYIQNCTCQHPNEYLAEIFNQKWIISQNIDSIKESSFTLNHAYQMKMSKRKKTYTFTYGVRLKENAHRIDTTSKGIKVYLGKYLKNSFINYDLDPTTKLITAKYGKYSYVKYKYDNFSKLINVVYDILGSNPNLKEKPAELIDPKTPIDADFQYNWDSKEKLIKKIEYVFPKPINLFENKLGENYERIDLKIRTVWKYKYDDEGKLFMIEINKMTKGGNLKRYRTIEITYNKDSLPIKTFDSFERNENQKFTTFYDYEYIKKRH